MQHTVFHQTSRRGSGKANNFFNNEIFRIEDLLNMAYGRMPVGHLQLPVPHDNRPPSIYQAIVGSGSEGEHENGDGGAEGGDAAVGGAVAGHETVQPASGIMDGWGGH